MNRATGKGRAIAVLKRRMLGLAAVAVLMFGVLSAGCGRDSGDGQPAGAQSAASPEAAVTDFYSAKTKHGFATFNSGPQPDERVEFWFDEDGRYRLTWYYPEEKSAEIAKYGPVRLHMISPDGKAVYYARPENKASEIAYVRAEKQQWTFNGPPGWTPDAGVEQDGYTVFTYTPEKLWDVEGASQQFYLYDMQVFAKDGRIDKVAMRTSSKKVPVEELVDSEFRMDEVELGASLPDDVFELPYPMAK